MKFHFISLVFIFTIVLSQEIDAPEAVTKVATCAANWLKINGIWNVGGTNYIVNLVGSPDDDNLVENNFTSSIDGDVYVYIMNDPLLDSDVVVACIQNVSDLSGRELLSPVCTEFYIDLSKPQIIPFQPNIFTEDLYSSIGKA